MSGDNSHNEPPDERTQRELAALADGSLRGARREALEARVAASPDLRLALERQRSARGALRGLDLPAPAGLRQRIESERARPSAPVRRRLLAIGGALAGAAAAIALAAVLVLPSGSGGPTIVEAAQLSVLPATQPSAPVDPAIPIDPPADARPSTRNGVQLNTTSDGGRQIVTWFREGRTCVVSGKDVSAKDLREVASWKGDGTVPF